MNKQLEAFKDLEHSIMSLKSAALILTTLHDDFAHRFENHDEANAFGFQLYDVQRRADELERQFAACFQIGDG